VRSRGLGSNARQAPMTANSKLLSLLRKVGGAAKEPFPKQKSKWSREPGGVLRLLRGDKALLPGPLAEAEDEMPGQSPQRLEA